METANRKTEEIRSGMSQMEGYNQKTERNDNEEL